MKYFVNEKGVYEFDWMLHRLFNMLYGDETYQTQEVRSIIDQFMRHPNTLFKAEKADAEKVGKLVDHSYIGSTLLPSLLAALDKPLNAQYCHIITSIHSVGSFALRQTYECTFIVTRQENLTALFRQNTIDAILRDLA